jgi:hypothetical protein
VYNKQDSLGNRNYSVVRSYYFIRHFIFASAIVDGLAAGQSLGALVANITQNRPGNLSVGKNKKGRFNL